MSLFNLHKLRLQLTDYGSLLPYAILGGIAGILGTLVALSFELLINWLSMVWLYSSGSDNSKLLYLVNGQELVAQLCKLDRSEFPCPLNDLGIANLSLSYLPMKATLHEALDIITDSNTEAVLITGQQSHNGPAISGVLDRADIENHYRSHI